MEEINQFREKHNGDFVKYSNKELIGGLHTKIDKLSDKLADNDKKTASLQTNVFWLKTALIGIYTAFGAICIAPIRDFLFK